MKMTGLQINKLLPKTNCKECGSNTCLAFAMKLAARKADLSQCPYASDEAKEILGAAAEPPVKTIELGPEQSLSIGGETCLYRHEKTFVNQTLLAVNVDDNLPDGEFEEQVTHIRDYHMDRVGETLRVEMIALTDRSGSPKRFAEAAGKAWEIGARPLVLRSEDPDALKAAASAVTGSGSILASATADTADELKAVAEEHGHALCVTAPDIDGLFDLTQKMTDAGFGRLCMELKTFSESEHYQANSLVRRAALGKGVKQLGFPTVRFITSAKPYEIQTEAITEISKYGGICVLPSFEPAQLAPLMTLRQNIYTDPQKPIQVDPKVYEVGEPAEDSPVFVTTNFSLTYFIVQSELSNSGMNCWLLVPDCEGMSVLTAWAAGKFDATTISTFLKKQELEEKLSSRTIIIPGYVAQVSGELEDELPGWDVKVGPQEAADIEEYVKQFQKQAVG